MAKKKTALQVDGRTLELSNLDKILFPRSGFTKAEVIDYYIRISPFLLPHLKDRPLTMKRYPDGIEGQHFYEKDAPKHTPDWVKTFPVPRKDRSGTIDFIMINDLATLVWSANLANIEMHTFLARAPKIQCPTVVAFDLDPGEPADVLSCAQVALWLREMLQILNLKSYPKVSGSKGIQLYVPVNTATTYGVTNDLAHTLAQALETLQPDLVVSSMSKSLRTGKVFIDWSQNADFKTTVSVYSLRAKREVPYVSVPLNWEELEQALAANDADSLYFEAPAAVERAERVGDLFAPVLELKQKIPANYRKKLEAITKLGAPLKSKATRKASKVAAMTGSEKSNRPESRHRKPAASSSSTSIETYNKKRDFTRTKEPAGTHKTKSKSTEVDGLMYVIQKHEASHLHYDFRLEMEGVLRSWAVPKGIPTDHRDKRLAMHVEDHPMDYARFEGIIPSGNYGAGTVMVWDIGTYEVEGGHPVRSYHMGKIPMTLKGKKLKGEWVLVRSGKDKYGKESWLLLKRGDSIPAIGPRKDDKSALTGRTMKQIAEARDAEWISNRPK